MSAVLKAKAPPLEQVEDEFRPPAPALTILDRMEIIARKVTGATVQPHVEEVMAYLTSLEMEAGLKAEIHKSDMANIRPDAVRTLQENAQGWRNEVKKDLIKFIVESTAHGEHITRAALKAKAGSLCAYRNFKGKNKQRIQDSVIDRWLTIKLEDEIRGEAAEKVRFDLNRARSNRP